MDIGLYQNAASLAALERWQDAVSQNISNSQLTAFKKRTVEFSGTNAGSIQTNPNDRLDLGEGRPAVFPQASSGISFKPGQSSPTQRDLDVALTGEGFFAVQAPDGSKLYTRSGDFHLRPDRTLVNSANLPVLGEGDRPIQLAAQSSPVKISDEGVITQGDTKVGKLAVYNFADTGGLTANGGGMYDAGTATPQAIAKPSVLQGNLEESNVSSLHEMVDLVTISRAYEANQKMITSGDETMQKTLDALG